LADQFIFGAAPIDYSPVLLLLPFGFHLTMDTLPSESTSLPAGDALPPPLDIAERQRDFNPPEQRAAQRTP
jgi:hypothetical protein